jgi:hypothetical protein
MRVQIIDGDIGEIMSYDNSIPDHDCLMWVIDAYLMIACEGWTILGFDTIGVGETEDHIADIMVRVSPEYKDLSNPWEDTLFNPWEDTCESR